MSDDRVKELDALVAAGAYSTRAEAVRDAVDRLLKTLEEEAIDRAIIDGYTRIPPTPEEEAWAEWSTVDSIEEEPW